MLMNPPPRLRAARIGERSPHHEGRFVGMMMAPVLAGEGHEECAEDVEGGHSGGEEADPEHPGRVFIRRFENQILAEIAGGERDAGDGDAGAQEHDAGDGNFLGQAAHLAQVLFAGKSVDHAAGSEEEKGLEEGVGHHVEDSCGEGSRAEADEHVAELRDGRVGEDLLYIVLDQADGGGEEGGREADDGDDV